jgi:hypothetical protein
MTRKRDDVMDIELGTRTSNDMESVEITGVGSEQTQASIPLDLVVQRTS